METLTTAISGPTCETMNEPISWPIDAPRNNSPSGAATSFDRTSSPRFLLTDGAPSVMVAGRSLPQAMLSQALAAFDQEILPLPPVPDSPEVILPILRNAKLLFDNGEFKLAMNLIRNVLLRCPNLPIALRLHGNCLRETGAYHEATRCFRALVAAQDLAENWALFGETLYLLELDNEALRAYGEALVRETESHPQLFEIYKNIGNIHVRAGDFESAEESYNKAYTLKPDSDALMVNYGTLEIQRENFTAAVERYRTAVTLNPRSDRGWVGLALVHRHMGDLDLSRANMERALDMNPRNKTALHLLVEWSVQAFDFKSAVNRLTTYLSLEGDDAEMSFLLAKILVHLNRLDEASLELERTLAFEPTIEGGIALMEVLQNERMRRSETQ